MIDPVCPEHGCEMRYEYKQSWWRGICDCPIRVFDEDREAYVPASPLHPPTLLRPYLERYLHHCTTWHRL